MPLCLRLIEPEASPHLDLIQSAVKAAGLSFASSPAPPGDAGAAPPSGVLLGIGPGQPEPLALARRLRQSAAPPALVFFAATGSSLASLRAALLRDPFLAQRYELVALDEPRSAVADRLAGFAERVLRQERHLSAVKRITSQLASLAAPGSSPRDRGAQAVGQASDHYLASILAQARDAILSTDAQGAVLTWNVAAEQLFGYPAEQAIGRPLGILDCPTPDDPQPMGESLGQLGGRVLRTQMAEQANVTCLRADGGEIEVSASLAPIRGAEGELLGLSVIARDVSEQQRLAEALREANRQKDEFLAIMSHELRTPLTSILGYTDMLLRGLAGPLAPRASGYLANVRSAGDRLLELVNGLLDYTRLEAGTERLDLQPVDLGEVVDQAVERTRPQATAKEIELAAVRRGEPGKVVADEAKLQHILRSFLANAVKFTPHGGRVRVEVGPDPEAEGMTRVAVSDSGIGLHREQLARVWERFYQADASLTRQYGGMGLGLAIAHHLAALHGGRVGAESPGPGQGSTFWLSLPRA